VWGRDMNHMDLARWSVKALKWEKFPALTFGSTNPLNWLHIKLSELTGKCQYGNNGQSSAEPEISWLHFDVLQAFDLRRGT
jgi:hypothetical protein